MQAGFKGGLRHAEQAGGKAGQIQVGGTHVDRHDTGRRLKQAGFRQEGGQA
jgi:hypothetical protein